MLESKHRRGGSTSLTTAIRACADRLATFHICRFSEQLNRLLIVHLTHLLPAYPRSLLAGPDEDWMNLAWACGTSHSRLGAPPGKIPRSHPCGRSVFRGILGFLVRAKTTGSNTRAPSKRLLYTHQSQDSLLHDRPEVPKLLLYLLPFTGEHWHPSETPASRIASATDQFHAF